MPNWTVVKAKILKNVTDFRYDKLSENALFVVRYKLAYLNFVDTCRRGYCALAQKYIKYFAILF